MMKTLRITLIIAISILFTGCASWWGNDVVVTYYPPKCRIIWDKEARAELVTLMDSELPNEEIFQKIAEYRRFCFAINDYLEGTE
jgi:hypothetical protein